MTFFNFNLLWQQLIEQLFGLSFCLKKVSRTVLDEQLQIVGVLLQAVENHVH